MRLRNISLFKTAHTAQAGFAISSVDKHISGFVTWRQWCSMPRKGSGKENVAICLCRSLNACTRSPALWKMSLLFFLQSWELRQRDLKIDWKGVHHQASASDSDAYFESPQKSQNLSPKISIKPPSCLLKLHWHSREAGLLMWTLKGHTTSPQCYSFHRVIMGHPGLDYNTILLW